MADWRQKRLPAEPEEIAADWRQKQASCFPLFLSGLASSSVAVDFSFPEIPTKWLPCSAVNAEPKADWRRLAGPGHTSDRDRDRDRGAARQSGVEQVALSRSGVRPVQAAQAISGEVRTLLYRDITPNDYELLVRLDEAVARPTASKSRVESLPTVPAEEALGKTCLVCLEQFDVSDKVSLLPECQHLFHTECVSKWLLERDRSCPVCSVAAFSN